MMKTMKEKEIMERKQKEKDKRKAKWAKGGKNAKVKNKDTKFSLQPWYQLKNLKGSWIGLGTLQVNNRRLIGSLKLATRSVLGSAVRVQI